MLIARRILAGMAVTLEVPQKVASWLRRRFVGYRHDELRGHAAG